MAIAKVTVPVPASGEGAPVDISHLVGSKTIVLTGTFRGLYELLASHDNTRFVPIAQFDAGGVEGARQTVPGAFQSARLRAATADTAPISGVTCEVSAISEPGENYFATLASLAAGASGASPVVDLQPLMPPNGPEEDIVFLCVGSFRGLLVVEGSLDGSRFVPLGSFRTDRLPEGSPTVLEFAVNLTEAKTRYVRANMLGEVMAGGVVVTVGGRVPAGGSGGSETLRQTYAVGVVAIDQTMLLLDAKGGPVVFDASHVLFTTADAAQVLGPAGIVLGVSRLEGIVVGPTNVLVGLPGNPASALGSVDATVVGPGAIVGGGCNGAVAVGLGASVAGGGGGSPGSVAIGAGATVGSGSSNSLVMTGGTVGNGSARAVALGPGSVVNGGATNGFASMGGVIDGGTTNCLAAGQGATIGGGGQHVVSIGTGSTVGGGNNNTLAMMGASVADGMQGAIGIGGSVEIGGSTCNDTVAIGTGAKIGAGAGGGGSSNCVALGKNAVIANNAQGSICVLGTVATDGGSGTPRQGICLAGTVTLTGGGVSIAIGGDAINNQCVIGQSSAAKDINLFVVRGISPTDGAVDTIRAVSNPSANETGLTLCYNNGAAVSNKLVKAAVSPPVGAVLLYVDP